ncbi:MAG: hypothetical protein ACTSVI_14785 [Promethearchaeota archaeon]
MSAEIQKCSGEINIITHNDPDGLVAAAITMRALFELNFGDVAIFYESPSNIQRNSSKILDRENDNFIGGFIIIIDLPYHESAKVWFDHHISEKDVKIKPNTVIHRHDVNTSAALLVYKFFKNEIKIKDALCDEYFLEYVNARDIGLEPSIVKKEYEILSNSVFEDRNDYDFFDKIIHKLTTNLSIKEIVKDSLIQNKNKRQLKKLNRSLKYLERIYVAKDFSDFMKTIDYESEKSIDTPDKIRFFYFKGFLFVDASDIGTLEKNRKYGIALPYYIIEKKLAEMNLNYLGMLIYRGDDNKGVIHCTVSINQAKEELESIIDVSKFAERYGGGGHQFVAGFSISPEKFLDVISDAIKLFRL